MTMETTMLLLMVSDEVAAVQTVIFPRNGIEYLGYLHGPQARFTLEYSPKSSVSRRSVIIALWLSSIVRDTENSTTFLPTSWF